MAAQPAASTLACKTSGFVATAYPTGNYGIDVHIDTGVLGISQGGFMSAVQDLVIAPVWMAIVWLVHAVLVMLEWGFSIDLLGVSQTRGLGSGLAGVRESLTAPLLPFALAAASVLAAYQGIVRRRVSYTFGNVGLMLAMMTGGLWVIANPTGTVGVLATWTNEGSLGALAAGSGGTTTATSGGLTQDVRGLFAMTVEGPWCYLEFGDVAWCKDPARLDPGARAAGLRIAAAELLLAACGRRAKDSPTCSSMPAAAQVELTRGAALLREARTNADLFLSLAPNSQARNSISEDPSLLRAICRSSEATTCQGSAAAQAQFRTNSGTWSRVGGLLLIAGGLSGILLIFGFLAIRLLTAATLSLLLLLLAPVAVLAPAFGERGRDLFRHWVGRLLGAVLAKLVFALLLGALFAVFAAISSLQGLGWWTQWLLMSSLAWTVFVRRNQALPLPGGGTSDRRRPRPQLGGTDRVRAALNKPRVLLSRARTDVRDAVEPSSYSMSQHGVSSLIAAGASRARHDAPGPVSHDAHVENEARARRLSAGVTSKRVQLARVQRAETTAFVASDTRRQVELADRASRIQDEIQREDEALVAARYLLANGRLLEPRGRASDVADAGRSSASRRANGVPGSPLGSDKRGGVHSADWPNGPGGRPEGYTLGAAVSAAESDHRQAGSAPVPWWLGPEYRSPIMDDIREVEAGRKRRLGFDQE